MIRKTLITAAFSTLLCTHLYAGDIAREVYQSDSDYDSFIEFGLSLSTLRLPLVGFNGSAADNENDPTDKEDISLGIGLQGQFQYKRLFLEFIDDSFSGATLGVNVKSNENFGLDFIVNNMFQAIGRSEFAGFETIENRSGDINAGFRNTYYVGDNIVQYELVGDVSGHHDGFSGTLQYGRQYQYRNWNFHSLLGVRYFSDKVIDHYFGVSEQESTEAIQAYQGDDGLMPTVVLGATLPINENWLFRSSIEYSRFPDSVSDSPLAQGDDMLYTQIGLYRVIYSR